MTRPRVLTKSRYKLGCECPTKLYYSGKPAYANQKQDDPFLKALAKGGYQVGELAKYYLAGGTEVFTLDQAQALAETRTLLEQSQVVVYEAALLAGNLFVRVDILHKHENQIDLYEVKSKSYRPDTPTPWWSKKGRGLLAEWRPYLEDIAFQKHVAMQVFPGYEVRAFLMLVNANALCPSEGLNQKFRVIRDASRRRGVQVSRTFHAEDLRGDALVIPVNVDLECDHLFQEPPANGQPGFADRVQLFSESCVQDRKIPPVISPACKTCEFRATPEERAAGLKDGRLECWQATLPAWTEAELDAPTVLDVWSYRKKAERVKEGRIRLTELRAEDFNLLPRADGPGLSPGERQWLQVEKAQRRDDTHFIDRSGLAAEMNSWTYPLHFIDFETSMVAIPFNKGRHPYEGIAFQFSHHVVHADGRVEHQNQYLNTEPGVFPNIPFARALEAVLDQDNGTIFRYANHENSYLNGILALLENDATLPDRIRLISFLESITQSKKTNRVGVRAMVDLWDLVKRYYFAPEMKGSNSIKAVLPATLRRSAFLQKKYAQPIYGAEGGIPSLNFRDMAWVRTGPEGVLDPYSLLPPVFGDLDIGSPSSDEDELAELHDGGAAMMAYTRLQFETLPEGERQAIRTALLKYCELDTLAMVMIFEAWRDWVVNP